MKKSRASSSSTPASSSASSPQTPQTLRSSGETYAPLTLRFETPLTSPPVMYKKKRLVINGIADFSLWYDDDETMAINLVCVQMKKEGRVDEANGQVVAYMGMYK